MAPTPQTKFNIYSTVNFRQTYINIYYPFKTFWTLKRLKGGTNPLPTSRPFCNGKRPNAQFRLQVCGIYRLGITL